MRQYVRQEHCMPGKGNHRGGISLFELTGQRRVYWAPTDDPMATETAMIDWFVERTGRLPYANKVRGMRARQRTTGTASSDRRPTPIAGWALGQLLAGLKRVIS
jgi:hypothetical protein